MKRLPKKPEVRKTESPEEVKGERLKAKGKKAAQSDAIENNPAPANAQDDKPNSESINSDIEHPKSEIKEMEVHHHPKVEKKSFKEYLLEGLMIFLAVTMGFFAETIRDNISESQKGKEYIRSFAQDLRGDIAKYDNLIAQFTLKDSVLNHLDACFDTMAQQGHAPKYLYNIIQHAAGFPDFVYSDRTIQQLKNAGGLRMIHDKTIADSIIDYDTQVRADLLHQEALEKLREEITDAHQNMLTFKSLSLLLSGKYALETSGPQLNSYDKKELSVYFNRIFIFKSACHNQLHKLKTLRQKLQG